eukprot:TRINITY_DN68921_c0_g1_i1.p1 TRINITY_DN68921_c0_g1~~TRINITY_DN68921_c0_g1_i1.p1  ORF type:complete len:479 (-),score=60.52 TRINITY_DN68921_c0_g1_i1:123-1559(-)
MPTVLLGVPCLTLPDSATVDEVVGAFRNTLVLETCCSEAYPEVAAASIPVNLYRLVPLPSGESVEKEDHVVAHLPDSGFTCAKLEEVHRLRDNAELRLERAKEALLALASTHTTEEYMLQDRLYELSTTPRKQVVEDSPRSGILCSPCMSRDCDGRLSEGGGRPSLSPSTISVVSNAAGGVFASFGWGSPRSSNATTRQASPETYGQERGVGRRRADSTAVSESDDDSRFATARWHPTQMFVAAQGATGGGGILGRGLIPRVGAQPERKEELDETSPSCPTPRGGYRAGGAGLGSSNPATPRVQSAKSVMSPFASPRSEVHASKNLFITPRAEGHGIKSVGIPPALPRGESYTSKLAAAPMGSPRVEVRGQRGGNSPPGTPRVEAPAHKLATSPKPSPRSEAARPSVPPLLLSPRTDAMKPSVPPLPLSPRPEGKRHFASPTSSPRVESVASKPMSTLGASSKTKDNRVSSTRAKGKS